MAKSDFEERNKTLDFLIESRHTIRKFRPESPPKDMIQQVLRAGLLAPYAQITISREDFRRFVVIPKESEATTKAASMLRHRTIQALEELERGLQLDPRQRARAERYLAVLRTASQQGPPNLGKAPYYIVVAEQRGIPDIAQLPWPIACRTCG